MSYVEKRHCMVCKRNWTRCMCDTQSAEYRESLGREREKLQASPANCNVVIKPKRGHLCDVNGETTSGMDFNLPAPEGL